MDKIYCYVDETGQDTQGDLFIVSVIITEQERERVLQRCEEIEQETGKGKVKWVKADYAKRLAYIKLVLQESALRGNLNFAVYRNVQDYPSLIVLTVARAIVARGQTAYKVTVLIDGLPRSQERQVGGNLRRLHIRVRKVRGVRKDENDALIRLADALCGFVRGAMEGQEVMQDLFEQGKRSGFLKEL